MAQAQSKLELILSANIQGLKQGLSNVGQGLQGVTEQAGHAAEAIRGMDAINIQQMGQSFQDVAGKISGITASSVAAAKEFGGVTRAFATAGMSSQQVAESGRMVRELALQTALTSEQLTAGAREFYRFGQASKESMTLAANVAAGSGQAFEGVVAQLAQLNRGGESTANAVRGMAQAYNIGSAELEKFGAHLSTNGTLMLDSVENVNAAGNAVQEALKNRWPTSAKTAQSASEELKREINELKIEVGQAGAEMDAKLTRAFLIPLVRMFRNEVPDGIKATVGALGGLSGWIAQHGAEMAGLVAQIAILRKLGGIGAGLAGAGAAGAGAAGAGGAATATAAGGAALLPSLPLVAGAAAIGGVIGFGGTTLLHRTGLLQRGEDMADRFAEAQRLAKYRQDNAYAMTSSRVDSWSGQTPERLREMGVSAQNVRQAIAGYNAEIEKVNSNEGMAAETRERVVSGLKAERDALTSNLKPLEDYNKNQERLGKGREDSPQEFAHKYNMGLKTALAMAAELDAEAREDRKTAAESSEDDKAKLIAQANAKEERARQLRLQNAAEERQAQVGVKQLAAESAQAQVDAQHLVIRERELAGNRTVEDRKKEVSLQLDLLKKQRDAEIDAIDARMQILAQSGKASTQEYLNLDEKKKRIDADYKNKYKENSQKLVEIDREDMHERLQLAQNHADRLIQIQQDYQSRLQQYRDQGIDVGPQERESIRLGHAAEVEKEEKRHQDALKQAGQDQRLIADENDRHQQQLAHLQAQRDSQVYQSQQRSRQQRADDINAERSAEQAALTGVQSRITALENLRSHGKNVEHEMAQAIDDEAEKRKKVVELGLEALRATEQNQKKIDAARKQAAADIAAIDAEVERKKQANHEAELQRQADVASRKRTELELNQQAMDIDLQRTRERGGDWISLLKQEQQMKMESLRLENEAAIATAERQGEEAKASAITQANLRMRIQERQNAEALRHALQEVNRTQNQIGKSMEDAFQSHLFGPNMGGFYLTGLNEETANRSGNPGQYEIGGRSSGSVYGSPIKSPWSPVMRQTGPMSGGGALGVNVTIGGQVEGITPDSTLREVAEKAALRAQPSPRALARSNYYALS